MAADSYFDLSEMADLLEEERRTLLCGKLKDLQDIARRKEELAAQLEAAFPPDNEGLREIRENMARNQRLMACAMEGIRAVSNRLEELRRVCNGLVTYGRDGKRENAATILRPKLEKRA